MSRFSTFIKRIFVKKGGMYVEEFSLINLLTDKFISGENFLFYTLLILFIPILFVLYFFIIIFSFFGNEGNSTILLILFPLIYLLNKVLSKKFIIPSSEKTRGYTVLSAYLLSSSIISLSLIAFPICAMTVVPLLFCGAIVSIIIFIIHVGPTFLLFKRLHTLDMPLKYLVLFLFSIYAIITVVSYGLVFLFPDFWVSLPVDTIIYGTYIYKTFILMPILFIMSMFIGFFYFEIEKTR